MLRPMRVLRRITKGLTAAWAAAVMLLWPVVAMAQDAPPAPSLRKTAPIWLGLLLIGAMLVVIMIVSVMPSKRSHQD